MPATLVRWYTQQVQLKPASGPILNYYKPDFFRKLQKDIFNSRTVNLVVSDTSLLEHADEMSSSRRVRKLINSLIMEDLLWNSLKLLRKVLAVLMVDPHAVAATKLMLQCDR